MRDVVRLQGCVVARTGLVCGASRQRYVDLMSEESMWKKNAKSVAVLR